MTGRVYLDWNAAAPLRQEARAAMAAALEINGNPSSVHAEGRKARALVDHARENVAALVGANARNVIFTSGGTEANALALTPSIIDGPDRRPRERLMISSVEHASVRAGGRFAGEQIMTLPVLSSGDLDLAQAEPALAPLKASGAGFLVSVMHANNETGVIQPIAQVAKLVHAAGGLLHVDAVQSAGKIACDIATLGADLLTISAHKIGGPKGVGALLKARETLQPNAMITGGGQEYGARAGTENVSGIVGFGAAAAAARREFAQAIVGVTQLKDYLEQQLRSLNADTVVFGDASQRLPNTTLFAVPGIKADTALIALDLDGVAVSAGSACSSGKVAASQVLEAMGVPLRLAGCAIRVSIGPVTTRGDVDFFLSAWEKRLRGLHKEARKDAA
jgi:cysteine desulfurase